IAPCPRVLAPVAFAQAGKLGQQLVRTSPLQVLHSTRHRQTGRNAQQHMHVVAIDRSGVNNHFVCPGCLAQQLTTSLADIPAKHGVTIFRHPIQVMVAVPDGMACALVALHAEVYTALVAIPCRLKPWGRDRSAARVHLRVRWLIQWFPAGPQSGSHHAHVSASLPAIPSSGISPTRFLPLPFLRSSPPALADLHRMKLHSSRAVDTEVGFSLAHSNPFCSWTRDPWSTSPCRHGPSLAPEHVS